MLIVLEGLDGAGKSTQVKKLRKYLSEKCSRLEYIHFPRYDSAVYGGLIGKFLRGGFGSIGSVHPQLVALLYAEDRHRALPAILDAVADDGTLLLDRYVYSNIAYQCAKTADAAEADELRRWISDTEFGDFALPKPDLNIFLDVPIDFVEKNLNDSRAGDSDRDYLDGSRDIHEADIEFQKKVREMYVRQASYDPLFKVVDCSDAEGGMLPSDEIFARIRKLVDEYI